MSTKMNILEIVESMSKALDGVDSMLSRLAGDQGFKTLSELKGAGDLEKVLEAKSLMLSSLTMAPFVLPQLMSEAEGLRGDVVERLQMYLQKLWRLIIKYIELFEVDKIVVRISASPSVSIEFKRG